MVSLKTSDPKFDTPECVQARNIAMQYDDKPLARNGLFVLSLMLGPIGMAADMAAENSHAKTRAQVIEEMQRRCVTGEPESP